MKKIGNLLAVAGMSILCSMAAWGQGVVLLGGDDLNDSGHGSRSAAGVNIGGWKFIENALVNMNAQVKRQGPFTVDVVALTSAPAPNLTNPAIGNDSPTAILSASKNANLTIQYVDGAANVTAFFASLAAKTVNPKIIWIPGNNVSGGTDSAEEAALAANAAAINAFVGSGGGLMSHDGDYTWLSAVLPGLTHTGGCSSSSLGLTPYGKTVFPNILDSELRFDACHGHFNGNFGGLQVLAQDAANAIIIGGLTGTGGLTDPGSGGLVHPVTCFSGPVMTDVPVVGAITSTLPAPVIFSIVKGNLGFGLRMDSTGAITGTPGIKGTFAYSVLATDATATVTQTHCELVVYGPQPVPSITTACPLNSATVGTAFSQTITTTGGVGTLSYSISAGALPAGLSLSTSGVLSGTPTASGAATFSLSVTDVGIPVQTATKACSMTVNAAPVAPAAPVVTMSCPFAGGTVGAPYHLPLTATSASGVTWRLIGGALPGGLILQSGGGIVGTPHTAGTYAFTLTATNAVGSVTINCSIVISPAGPVVIPAPSINTACPLSNATVGSVYSAAFTSSNGVAPLTYSVSAGTLPAGLALSSGGVLSGTPTAAGASSFTILVSDSTTPTAQTGSKACSLTVNAAPPPASAPTITSACPLATGTQLINFTQTVAASGGTAPYVFSVVSGALPRPMTLTAGGVLSGAPYHAGVYNFTLQVAGNDGLTSQKACSMTINTPHGSPVSVSFSRGSVRYGEETESGMIPVEFELSEALPFSVTGRAYLVARSKNGGDSDEVRFVTGGREADFVIEAGQTTARFNSEAFGILPGDHSMELVVNVVLESASGRLPVDLAGTESVRSRVDH